MNNIKKILLPVDIFEKNKAIESYVASWPKDYEAVLTILHVVPTTPSAHYALTAKFAHDLVKKSEELMEDFVAQLSANPLLQVKGEILEGHPADVISDYAKGNGIDLIIMATHQRGELERLFLGSVTSKVITMSPVPVLAIPPKH